MDYSAQVERKKKNFYREKFETCGITFPEGIVLLVIGKGWIKKQDDVSTSSGIDKYRMTRIMTKLESENLIYRETNAANKREKSVKLTEKGQKMYCKLAQVIEEWEKLCFTDFSKEEMETFTHLVEKIVHNLENIKG